jgi:ribbon-helix-helix CopG family protein
MVSVPEEMFKALDKERRARLLDSVPEAIRSILGEYFKMKQPI